LLTLTSFFYNLPISLGSIEKLFSKDGKLE
jgi:hypothetical protein